MPKVRELRDCPLCFGRLLPLSVCQSCNSVAAREGLDEVSREITCEDCGAANPTQFVCSACNARFPYREIVNEEGPTCPVCKSSVPPGAALCPNCSAVLPTAGTVRPKRRIRGEYGEEDIHEVGRIPGVGRQRAEVLCAAGYNALWKIARASEAELARVRGIGPRNASQIKENLRFLLLVGRPKTKEEVLSEEYECPLCGTTTSLFATRCHDCGARFDDEEMEEDFRKEVEREEDKGLLAYYDVRLLEEPENATLHYARGVLLLGMGRPADALASLDKVLELVPSHSRALQAKARALSGAKGTGAAAQVLHDVAAGARKERPAAPSPAEGEVEALAALGGLAEVECPECGEKQLPEATVCPVCGHRFAPEEPTPRGEEELAEERLLDELERAVAGEMKAPPPPLKPEVPTEVVDRKRAMLTFLLRVSGVSRRAAEAVSGFFQDLEQIGLSEAADLAQIPGVAPAEARLIKEAVDHYFAPAPAEAPEPEVPPEAAAPPPMEALPRARPPGPRPSIPPAPVSTRPPLVAVAGRRGLINGRGLVNGRGRVNGLINGTGFVNGSAVAELRLPQRHLMPRYVAIGVSMLMLFAVAWVLLQPEEALVSGIDGEVDEWSGIPRFSDGTTTTNQDVLIMSTSTNYDLTSGTLFLLVTVRGQAFGDPTEYDTLYAFVDADGDVGTGYDLATIGADYMARVSGFAGTVEDARLLKFTGGNRADWNGWQVSGPVVAASRGVNVELGVSTEGMTTFDSDGFRVLYAFDDNDRATSHTEVPVGGGRSALRVTQTAPTDTVGVGIGQIVLRLEFTVLGEGTVQVSQVLLRTDANGSYDSIAAFAVSGGQPRVEEVRVDTTGLPTGAVVSAGVASVDVGVPYAVVGAEARAYVGAALASQKRIDGLFSDWQGPLVDSLDSPPIRRPSLDIVSRDGSVVGSDVFLYARLGATPLEGTLAPQVLRRPQPATGGAGGGGAPGPAPPPLVGFDFVRFYVNTNESRPGGFPIGSVSADYLIEAKGRGGRILEAAAYRWTGATWQREGPARALSGSTELEMSVALPAASFNMTRVVTITADWSGPADAATAEQTRSRGGLLLVPLSNPPGLQTATATPLDVTPTVDANCDTGLSGEYSGADEQDAGNFKFFVGYRLSPNRVFVCIDFDADTQSNPADFGELVLDRSHDGGTAPQTDDRRFNVTVSGGLASEKGTGSGWTTCGGSCYFPSGAVALNNSAHMVYEFSLSFWDVWATNSTSQALTAGFAIQVHDENAGVDYTWGSSQVNDDTPDSWGHLEIPEFERAAFAILAMFILVLPSIRRRRR